MDSGWNDDYVVRSDIAKIPDVSLKRANALRMAKLKGTMSIYNIGQTAYVELAFADRKDAQSFYDLLEAL